MSGRSSGGSALRGCGLLLGGGVTVAVLLAALPDPALLARALEDPGLAVAELGVEGALVQLLATGAWACLAWLTLVGAVAVLAHLPGTAGRTAGRVAAVVTPTLVRRAVEALLGASALAGVVTPGAASAGPPPALTTSAVTAAVTVAPDRAPGASTAALAAPQPASQPAPAVPSADWPGRLAPVLPTADWPAATPQRPAAQAPAAAHGHVAAAPGLVTAPARDTPADASVVVRRGDTLWSIAASHLGRAATPAQVARAWPEWHRANRDVIGADPDRLLPGQRLVPPTT